MSPTPSSPKGIHATRATRRTSLLLLFVHLLLGLSLIHPLHSADFYWDADTLTLDNQNGSGTWSSNPANLSWTTAPGNPNLPWVNADDSIAYLSAAAAYTNTGIGGVITLEENITLNQLIVGSQAGSYQIDSAAGGPYLLQFDGLNPVIRNNSSQALLLNTALSSTSMLAKEGTGMLVLNAPITTLPALHIRQGGVTANVTNVLPANTAVTIGSGSTTGALHVQNDLTIASLNFASTSGTNQVLINNGSTLTVNGNLINGILDMTGITAATTTNTNISGNGSLVVQTSTGNLVVSAGASTVATHNQTLNLSGLKNFTSTTNNIYIGRGTTPTGSYASQGRPRSNLILAENNQLTANHLLLGVSNESTTDNFLDLGETNELNINTMVIGGARSVGRVRFRSDLEAPTLVLRGQTGGNSRTTIYLGDSRNASALTGVGGSSHSQGHMDFTGGTVDLMIDSLTIGIGGTENGGYNGGAYGRGTGTFTFGGKNSVVDINHLVIGMAVDISAVAAGTADPYTTTFGTFTMNGGSLFVNQGMTIGLSHDAIAGNQQNIQSTFNLNDGTAVVTAPILLGHHTSTGTGNITATMNLNGGSLSVEGDITRGDALTVGTINLNGSHLDLNGHHIGDATNPVTFNLTSGELANLGEFNDGAALIKTGAGQVSLLGTNTYTGETIVNGGTLIARSNTAVQNTSKITVANGGTFAFDDGVGGTLTLPTATGVALELKDGSSIGAQLGNSTGSIVVQSGATVLTDNGAAILVNIHNNSGSTPPPSSILLSAVGGGITSNGATYGVGVVYGATDFTVALSVTDEQIAVTTTSASALPAAYWKGGFTLDNNTWSASNGSTTSNWSSTSDGSTNTSLVPGANTDVYFSATTSTLPATTDLGADMTIKSLTVNTANPLTLDDELHTLSITAANAITINNTAGAVKFNTHLQLLDAAPIIHVDNAGGFTLSGSFSAANADTITKTGTGLLLLDLILASHNAKMIINDGTVAISSEEALGSNPDVATADQLTLNGGTLRAMETFRIDDTNRGITIGTNGGTFEVDAHQVLSIDNIITSTGTLTKTGSGTLEITTPVTSTADTIIKGGTLSLVGSNNTLPSNQSITFDATKATLNVNDTSQTVNNLIFNTHAGTGPMNITITGEGGTLINNATANAFFRTETSAKPLYVDMSGLTNFTHNGANYNLEIGLTTSATSPNSTTPVTSVRLAENNTITSKNILISEFTSSGGGGYSELILGQTNVFNTGEISIANSRSSGSIHFDPTLIDPTLKVRGVNGTSALPTWDMGQLNTYSNSVWTSTADFTGGTIDVLVTNLNVGSVHNRQGTLHATFIMDKGILTATNMVIGNAQGTDTANPGTRTANSIFSLIGEGTVNVTNMIIGRNTANVNHASADPNANGTLNISAGTVNVGAGGIVMGQANTTDYDASATINLTGGALNVSGNIAEAPTGTGDVVSTINLHGGTLNLNNKNIGTAARNIDNLMFISGTLQNVAEINGGGAIAKTGSSHDVLVLDGTNTHTGTTTVSSGTYLVNGTHTGGGNYSVEAGATLGGNGSITLATNASYTLDPNATLQVGDGIGTAQELTLTSSGSGSLSFADSSSILSTRILLDPGSGGTDHSSDPTTADLLSVFGEISLNGATLNLLDANTLGLGFSLGDTWRLFDWTGVTSSDLGTGTNTFSQFVLPTLSEGLMWDTTNLYTAGTITIAVPEPGKATLIITGLLLTLLRRQRRCPSVS